MNASNEKALNNSARKEKDAARQYAEDFLWLASDPRGRRFLWRMMGHCRIFQPVFDTHGSVMNFNEGRRGVGLFLLGEINRLCPAQYAVMATENAPQPEEKNDD
jgi:hypothetical protein